MTLLETLSELERLEKAATPGKWRAHKYHPLQEAPAVDTEKGEFVCETASDCEGMGYRDAQLIAALRNNAPELLKSLRSLMAENEALKKERDELAGRAQRSFDNLMKDRDTLQEENVKLIHERNVQGLVEDRLRRSHVEDYGALQAQLKDAQEALRGAVDALGQLANDPHEYVRNLAGRTLAKLREGK